MNYLHSLHTDIRQPERFTYPFCYEPHPLCLLAAEEVKKELGQMTLTEGKMFGVLVVDTSEGLGFLAAYSGLLEGRNDWPYFVPPVYDAQQPDGYFKTREREISLTTHLKKNVARTPSVALSSVSATQCTRREAGSRRDMARLPLFCPYPPSVSPATRRHRRLLCTQAATICL